MSKYNLKPCPFCGEPVKLDMNALYMDGTSTSFIRHVKLNDDCPLYGSKTMDTDKLVKAWNERV
jgi:hypothetical protein